MLNPKEEIMNHHTDATDEDGVDALENGILDALRRLPSEQGGPAAKTDAAVLRMAAATMARIRRRSLVRRAMWGVFAAAACLALALLLFERQAGTPSVPPQAASAGEDPAAIVLREVSALFPGQIRSIQRDASGLQLSLADAPSANQGRAVVLEIRKNGDSREIISFSGQTIEFMGHSVTIHTSEDGSIRLKGPDIEWLSDRPPPSLAGLQIHARLF
jgi:hypothetical protein